ncbi:hypothetical protein PCANC_21481 [Puccinia coronata f. sp. avenae]|uniref:Uncharacterized protein n=1 Tax=Puccinia coronata f. sp. avenae TaxID=200324 RepID=A0A2N5RVV9_9BASI|nr:hypothetical protein PCANC_27683 [Puccinia coronata f. sp. avenae]PLW26449.1 hypothetical protein PCASD_23404 [Puccinia coronata f. sp. avenae]PLW26552.1 hypothetical protein PCASD_25078 [Puccinia coronata f. sp. avenae]PLW31122.1 hypothetical protein PCANC_21481 [Puccinia coronata f. sp. avenae]
MPPTSSPPLPFPLVPNLNFLPQALNDTPEINLKSFAYVQRRVDIPPASKKPFQLPRALGRSKPFPAIFWPLYLRRHGIRHVFES